MMALNQAKDNNYSCECSGGIIEFRLHSFVRVERKHAVSARSILSLLDDPTIYGGAPVRVNIIAKCTKTIVGMYRTHLDITDELSIHRFFDPEKLCGFGGIAGD
jgi:hypothetical protein